MENFILKIGGSLLSKQDFLRELAGSFPIDYWQPVILHGGGPTITKLFDAFGRKSIFINGLRATNNSTIDLVEMALSGQINKYIARKLTHFGRPAVGISGTDAELFLAEPIEPDNPENNRVGTIVKITPRIVSSLIEEDWLPVISPIAIDANGNALNVNADYAACRLAIEMKAKALIFLSDVPGIIIEGKVIPELTPRILEREKKSGQIHSGMIPKLEMGFEALEAGVDTVLISTWQGINTLGKLLNQKDVVFTKLRKD